MPEGATFDVVSDLITLKTDEGAKPAGTRSRKIAEGFGQDFSEFATEQKIFNTIDQIVSAPGRETDLTRWYTFWVYHDLMGRDFSAPISSPADPIIIEVATLLAQKETVLQSMRRQLEKWGAIRYFGDIAGRGGIGYKESASLLKERLGIEKKVANPRAKQDVWKNDDEANVHLVTVSVRGTSSWIYIGIALTVAALVFVWLFR